MPRRRANETCRVRANLTVKAGALTPSEPPGVPLIPAAPPKPIRYWFEMGDQDLFYPNPTIPDGMHDWTLSAALMAKALADKGYHDQYLFAHNAKHVNRPTVAQTPPAALARLWTFRFPNLFSPSRVTTSVLSTITPPRNRACGTDGRRFRVCKDREGTGKWPTWQ